MKSSSLLLGVKRSGTPWFSLEGTLPPSHYCASSSTSSKLACYTLTLLFYSVRELQQFSNLKIQVSTANFEDQVLIFFLHSVKSAPRLVNLKSFCVLALQCQSNHRIHPNHRLYTLPSPHPNPPSTTADSRVAAVQVPCGLLLVRQC